MPGCLDKESKFGRNEFLRLGSRDILKFFRVDQVRNAWEGKNMEKKKRIKRHAAGLCAGLGILFAASVPMTAVCGYGLCERVEVKLQESALHSIRGGSRNTASRDRTLQSEKQWGVERGADRRIEDDRLCCKPLSDDQQAAEQHCENGGGNCGRNIHSRCRWNRDSTRLLKGVCG